jgi:hypothetical protein
MSVEFGYALSSEEHDPLQLVEHARRAEESGFTFALVSDHFHPSIEGAAGSAIAAPYGRCALRRSVNRTENTDPQSPAEVHAAVAACALAVSPTARGIGSKLLCNLATPAFGFGRGRKGNLHVLILSRRTWVDDDRIKGKLKQGEGEIQETWDEAKEKAGEKAKDAVDGGDDDESNR